MFKKILIANRGEIARRIQRTASKIGIQTVAVYSEADAGALHVREADEAVLLGPAPASESYLSVSRIIEAAKLTGAQAIHPGYGFLSENPALPKACEEAGLVFIGPSVHAIEVMGSKSAAKACVQAAGVPLIPGYFGAQQGLDVLSAEAERIGFPLMIKAVAGGGGKGIRAVHAMDEFEPALQSCRREAKNAFGDEAVMLEKLIVKPRHIEVQVFGDQYGQIVHLFERDCSAQRRHQKVLEEAPAWGLSEQQREKLGQTAVEVARAVNYVGAGTVEFLMDAGGEFYFMEMNTRLQVEHPVTEMVTGFDLVEWQMRIAAGERLPVDQAHIHLTGHAIEARLYAENPHTGFLPSIGEVALWEGENALAQGTCLQFEVHQTPSATPVVRLDGALFTGAQVTPFYDPMIGKLIVWASDRNQAVQALSDNLARLRCVGLNHNLVWLRDLCLLPEYKAGGCDTGVIDRNLPQTLDIQGTFDAQPTRWAALAGLARWALHAVQAVRQGGVAGDPLAQLDGFASAVVPLRADVWQFAGHAIQTSTHVALKGSVAFVTGRCGNPVTGEYFEHPLVLTDGVSELAEGLLRCQGMLGEDCFDLIWNGDELSMHLACEQLRWVWSDPAKTEASTGDSGHGVKAPMPGKVFAVFVKPGDEVVKGQPLIGLEAMKMEHTLTSPADAVVESIPFGEGCQVQEGTELIHFTVKEQA